MDNRNLSSLPNEVVVSSLLIHLSLFSIRQFSITSKKNFKNANKHVQQYKDRFQFIYYAVGAPIDLRDHLCMSLNRLLFRNSFNNEEIMMMRTSFSNTEIMDSLVCENNPLYLFTHHIDANSYKNSSSTRKYSKFQDIWDTYKTPAIFVVKINDVLLCNNVTLLEDGSIKSFNTPAKNLNKLYFARLGNFFAVKREDEWCWNRRFPESFYNIWEESMGKNVSLNQTIINLLSSYSDSIFAVFTQHHQEQINPLLKFMKDNRDMGLNDMCDHFLKLRDEAHNNPAIQQDDDYVKMLEFVTDKLTELKEVNVLQQIQCLKPAKW